MVILCCVAMVIDVVIIQTYLNISIIVGRFNFNPVLLLILSSREGFLVVAMLPARYVVSSCVHSRQSTCVRPKRLKKETGQRSIEKSKVREPGAGVILCCNDCQCKVVEQQAMESTTRSVVDEKAVA